MYTVDHPRLDCEQSINRKKSNKIDYPTSRQKKKGKEQKKMICLYGFTMRFV